MKRPDVYKLIDSERHRQEIKWGADHDGMRSTVEWTLILQHRLGLMAIEACDGYDDSARRSLIKIAAVAVAALEALPEESSRGVEGT